MIAKAWRYGYNSFMAMEVIDGKIVQTGMLQKENKGFTKTGESYTEALGRHMREAVAGNNHPDMMVLNQMAVEAGYLLSQEQVAERGAVMGTGAEMACAGAKLVDVDRKN